MNKQAVVLSGGGVKGIGHLAFLETMESRIGKPDMISGSSAGALTGVLYAAGCSKETIIDFYHHSPLARLTYLSRTKPGFYDSKKFINIFKDLIPDKFEDLNIPVTIAATNLEWGDVKYFSEGDLYRPLIASCAVPMIFSPISIDGYWYVDGGASDNFPIKPVQSQYQNIYGSYVSHPMIKTREQLNSTLKVVGHSNAILIHHCNKHKMELFDAVAQFPLSEYTLFESKSINAIYNKCQEFMKTFDFNK